MTPKVGKVSSFVQSLGFMPGLAECCKITYIAPYGELITINNPQNIFRLALILSEHVFILTIIIENIDEWFRKKHMTNIFGK